MTQASAQSPVIVLRDFKFPKRNKCKPFVGVISTSVPSLPSAVTGSACASFDGVAVTFAVVAMHPPVPGFAGIDLRYTARVTPTDSTTGSGLMTSFVPGADVITNPISAYECHNAFPDNV